MHEFNWFLGFILPYANFAIFLFLAVRLFRRPLQSMVGTRKADFQRSVEEAKSAKTEAEAKLKEVEARLRQLTAEIEGVKARAIAEAQNEAELIMRRAHSLASHIQTEAKRMAETEFANAKKSIEAELIERLRNEVQDLLHQSLTPERRDQVSRHRLRALHNIVRDKQ